MGHANLSNISQHFINRLFAKGRLSLRDCVESLVRDGETLHASEGAYEDESMLGMGVMEVINFLQDGRQPWIEPDFDPTPPPAIWKKLTGAAKTLVRAAKDTLQLDPKASVIQIAADAVEEAGHHEWAQHIRMLPRMRELHEDWVNELDDNWDWDEGKEGWIFDRILWRFTAGKRMRYRDCPVLGNVTN